MVSRTVAESGEGVWASTRRVSWDRPLAKMVATDAALLLVRNELYGAVHHDIDVVVTTLLRPPAGDLCKQLVVISVIMYKQE